MKGPIEYGNEVSAFIEQEYGHLPSETRYASATGTLISLLGWALAGYINEVKKDMGVEDEQVSEND